jgi:stress response protein YsnF
MAADKVGEKGKAMNYEKIVTLYDTSDHADAARRNLETAGFPSNEISVMTNKTIGLTGSTVREPGLWRRLFGREILEHEATIYGRAIDAGGAILTIRVPETDAARATSILNAHQSVDVFKRAVQEGLVQPASKPVAVPPAATVTPATATRSVGAVSGEDVLALAEEEISVGKRVIQEGTTRIRRFVTEKPVEAQVTLHEEHARILRRAIADPNYLQNIDWTDKVIEVTETAEEPVITKSAHVAEEVVIQREGSDQVKVVKDKVRRQQVEVERLTTEPTRKK